jgi:hypothetical protein
MFQGSHQDFIKVTPLPDNMYMYICYVMYIYGVYTHTHTHVLTAKRASISFKRSSDLLQRTNFHCGLREPGFAPLHTAWPTTRPSYSTSLSSPSTTSLSTLSPISLSKQQFVTSLLTLHHRVSLLPSAVEL